MARLAPLLQLQPEGGQVVVTRFECPSLRALVIIRLRHSALKRHVRRKADGFIAVRTVVDWRKRTMLSISLWQSLDSIYAMGNVRQHVAAARVPRLLGVATTCGIYYLVGDWRRVMFRGAAVTRSPLYPLDHDVSLVHAQERGS
jgi:hypothetical protein